MTSIILNWVVTMILNVGLVLFGFWLGRLSCRKEKARYEKRIIALHKIRDSLEEELEDYTSKTWPVSYYYESADRQAFDQYALESAANWHLQVIGRHIERASYSHKFEDIEAINILKPSTFSKTIALAVRDHGLKVKETATEIKVWQEMDLMPHCGKFHETVLKKVIKEK